MMVSAWAALGALGAFTAIISTVVGMVAVYLRLFVRTEISDLKTYISERYPDRERLREIERRIAILEKHNGSEA